MKLWLQKKKAISPVLTCYSAGMLAMIPILVVAWVVDERQVMGLNVWIKPLKFTFSGLLYAVTLLALTPYLEPKPLRTKQVLDVAGGMLGLEMLLIYFQAMRGKPSHFNNETLFDMLIFNAMAVGITIFWIMNLVLMIWFLRQQVAFPSLKRGILWGFASALLGMLVGFLMSVPNATQMAALQAGQHVALMGAHTVGSPDGGLGLPFLNWSLQFGDLRVAHFFGIHAMQVLPVWAAFLENQEKQSFKQRLHRIDLAGAGYLGLFFISVWQAMKAESITQPSSETLMVTGLWFGLLIFGWWFIGREVKLNKSFKPVF